LWDILVVRPRSRELAHVVDVAARQAGHPRELSTQVCRQSLDDLGAPPFILLSRKDLPANPPVEPDQLLVDGERSARAGRADLALKPFEQLGVVARKCGWRRLLPRGPGMGWNPGVVEPSNKRSQIGQTESDSTFRRVDTAVRISDTGNGR
jgi:hypothetical protein